MTRRGFLGSAAALLVLSTTRVGAFFRAPPPTFVTSGRLMVVCGPYVIGYAAELEV
jgi:hypothetical protein